MNERNINKKKKKKSKKKKKQKTQLRKTAGKTSWPSARTPVVKTDRCPGQGLVGKRPKKRGLKRKPPCPQDKTAECKQNATFWQNP